MTADSTKILTVQSVRIANLWIAPENDAARSVRITSGASSRPGKLLACSRGSGYSDVVMLSNF